MVSADLERLRERIDVLREVFLPEPWDALGFYDDGIRELAAAFTVMAHAEIEAYVEARVLAFANRCEADWIASGSETLALAGFVRIAFEDAPKQALEAPSLDHLIRTGRRMVDSRVGGNHGIKEANLGRLLEGVGIELSALPIGLVQRLSSLGGTRGIYAHNSGGARNLVNPKDEHDIVALILVDLEDFDALTGS